MIDSAVFKQVTTECPYTLLWVPLSPKITPSHGDLWEPIGGHPMGCPHLTHASLGSEPTTQTASHLVLPFLHIHV